MDNLPDNKTKLGRIISYVLSAILPIIIMGAAFALNGVYPFGAKMIILGDFWDQYYPFISDYWHKLHDGASLLWSWTAGAGHDYVSHFAYYLASPFNLLAALFPHALLRAVLFVFLLIKLGFAGLFMSIYLRYLAKWEDILAPVFSSMYALCAFALGYYCNIMWLDTFALLPLVVLGVHKLVNEGEFQLYVLSLAGAVIFNFYIGFFICVFTAIWFFALCTVQKLKPREFLHKLALIAMYSALGIGIAAFILLPAYAAIQHTYGAVYSNVFPEAFKLRHSFFDVLGNFISFSPPTLLFGLPNIASGMISIMLLPVFFLAKKISLKEKLAYLLVIAFLIISTNVNVLDYLWHALSYPNAYPARYSFLISFVIIAMAYRAYISAENFSIRDILAMSGGAALLLIIAALGVQDTKYVIWGAILGGVYVSLFAFLTKERGLLLQNSKKDGRESKGKSKEKSKRGRETAQAPGNAKKVCALKLVLFAVILTELSFTAFIAVKAVGTADVEYPPQNSYVQKLLDLRPAEENSFYRTDFTWHTSYNDTSLYGYSGIPLFNTLADSRASSFMEGLGLPSLGLENNYYYARTSPLTDAFLNMRYLIDHDLKPTDKSVFWDRVGQAGKMVLFENKRYLPLGFMVKEETAGFKGFAGAPYRPLDDELEHAERLAGIIKTKTAGYTPFSAQNDLFSRATGLQSDLFLSVEAKYVESDKFKTVAQGPGEFTFTSAGNSAQAGTLFFDYCMPKSGYLYVYIWVEGAENAMILLEGAPVHEFNIDRPHIYRAGSFKQGQYVTIAALSLAKSGEAWVYAAVLDQGLFEQGYALLAEQTLELTEFTDTKIAGHLAVLEDGLLYTSIPHAGLWRVFVDGSQVDLITIDGAMAALWLDAGKHTVEFRYHNSALIVGVIISAMSALVFFATIVYRRRRGSQLTLK